VSQEQYDELAKRVVEEVLKMGAKRSPRSTIDYLVQQLGVERSVLRAVLSNLVITGGLELTPDLKIAAPMRPKAA
jgi:DNA-binding FadR family transcriptional regulator